MRVYIYLASLLVILMLLAGCSKADKTDENEYNYKIDYPYMYHDDVIGLTLTQAETGYYVLQDHLIYFMDQESMNPVIIDDRPESNCMHEGYRQNCFAYVKGNYNDTKRLLQYYDSHLYVTERTYERNSSDEKWTTQLYRLDVDEKQRIEIKDFPYDLKSIAIHRDYIYFSTYDLTNDSVNMLQIIRSPLDNPTVEEVLYESEIYSPNFINAGISMIPYANQLYWTESEENRVVQKSLNLKTKEATVLWDREDNSSSSIFEVSDQRLYFNYLYNTIDDPRTLKIYSSDIYGNDIQEVQLDHPPMYSKYQKDNHYSYIRPANGYHTQLPEDTPYELAILKDNEKIDKINLDPLPTYFNLYTGDDRYMFIRYYDETKEGYYYIDKQKFGTGQAIFEPLLESKVYRL